MTSKLIRFILPIFLGALGGYLYYNFIGCNNGCAITGNPITSTAYGLIIGVFFADWKSAIQIFKRKRD